MAERHLIKVGVAAALGLILVFYAVYFVGKNPFRKGKTYEFRVVFDDVQGLGVDSEVRLAGVPIGRVSRLGVRDDGKAVVTVAIEKTQKIPVKSRFSVQAGFLQDKTIDIEVSEMKAPVEYVKPGDEIEETVSPTTLEDLALDAHRALGRINSLLDSFNEVVADEALKADIFEIAENLRMTTREAHLFANALRKTGVENRENINAIIANVRTLTEDLDRTVRNVDSVVGNVNEVVGDEKLKAQVKEIVESLNLTIKNMEDVSKTLADLAKDEQVKDDIRGTIRAARETTEKAGRAVEGFNKILDAVSNTELRPNFFFRHEGRKDLYFADMNLRIFPPDRDVYYMLGLDNVGEESSTNLMLGVPGPHPNYWYRFGLKSGKLGIGVDWERDGMFLQGDLLDPNDLTLNLRVGRRVAPGSDLFFMIGLEDATKKDSLSVGLLQWY
ncbi:MAG: MlaD family protein [bacterium]